MRVMNKARAMMLEWGEAFRPLVSQGLGKSIVDGYQEMIKDGIRFPPLTESNKWTPCLEPESYHRTDFDIKDFYRRMKKVVARIDESGPSFLHSSEGAIILEECKQRLPTFAGMIIEARKKGDESTVQHLCLLHEMCDQVVAQEKGTDDDWSDDCDWSES